MKSVRICDKSQSEFPIDVVKCPNCGSFSSHYGIGEGEENTEDVEVMPYADTVFPTSRSLH